MTHEAFDVHLATVTLPFRLVDAGTSPGHALADEFAAAWPAYRRWFLHEGEGARPTFAESYAALVQWMPELLPDFNAAVDMVGGGDLEARFLSHWCPPPLVSACSMAMPLSPSPSLVRNYDYPALLSDALALRTRFSGRAVIGMSDCTLGLMDGVNDAGVAIALAFGGRREVGEGFGIGLVVRYLLQVATSTAQAIAIVEHLPVQMSYNLAIVDAAGDYRVAMVGPDRPAETLAVASAANRQGYTAWPEHAAYCNTVEREEHLSALMAMPGIDTASVVDQFLQAPLHRPLTESTWGTLYTTVYDCARGQMTLAWPDERWEMSVHGTDAGSHPRTVTTLVPSAEIVPVQPPRPGRVAMVI